MYVIQQPIFEPTAVVVLFNNFVTFLRFCSIRQETKY